MDRHDIDRHIRWSTEVVGARWDDDSSTWQVTSRTADGADETLAARALISAVGQLNRPNLPDIPGHRRVRGPSFHSARWDHSVDYRASASP